MSAKDITRCSVLGAILFAVYFVGSFFLYIDMANFIILLYGVNLKRKNAWMAVIVFCLLVILVKGFGPWSLMYLILFPQYIFIYSFVSKKTKSEYVYSIFGFLLAFVCGTIIGLPYTLTSGLHGTALWMYLVSGFMVDLGTGVCTFLATLFLSKPLGKVLKRLDR